MPTDVKIVHTSMLIDSAHNITLLATDSEGRMWISRAWSAYDLQLNPREWKQIEGPKVLA